MTPQEVGDEMSKGLHMMKHFEKEMNHHPFAHKLIAIGKPMMLGGLHNVLGMMEPAVMHHMCHHKGHHHCKSLVNNIIKGIILFLIWKIFESIDNRCCGMCESECLKKFKNDLNEVYGKISKVNNLLNESTLALNENHRIAMKIKSLKMIEGYMDDIKRQTTDFWKSRFDFDKLNKFLDEEYAKTKKSEYLQLKQLIKNYRQNNVYSGYIVGNKVLK